MCNSHDSDCYSNNNKHAHADDDSQDYPDLALLGCRSVGDGWSRRFWRDKQKTKFIGNVSFPTSHEMICFKFQSQCAVFVTVPTAFPEGFSSGTPKRPRDSDLRLYATEKQYLLTIGFWEAIGLRVLQKHTETNDIFARNSCGQSLSTPGGIFYKNSPNVFKTSTWKFTFKDMFNTLY